MTPKEIMDIAARLDTEDQFVWLHIHRHDLQLLGSKEFVDGVAKTQWHVMDEWSKTFHALPEKEKNRWIDAVMTRAYRIGMDMLQRLMNVTAHEQEKQEKQEKAQPLEKYRVIIPLTTHWGTFIWATSPEQAIQLAVKKYSPAVHLPKYTEDLPFTLETTDAVVENENGRRIYPPDED